MGTAAPDRSRPMHLAVAAVERRYSDQGAQSGGDESAELVANGRGIVTVTMAKAGMFRSSLAFSHQSGARRNASSNVALNSANCLHSQRI